MEAAPGSPGDGPLDATSAVTALYSQQYARLVRLAWLLTRDQGRAEELVQDAFVDLHQRWARLQEPAAAVAYLRQSVLNRSRSALRHVRVVRAHDARAVLTDVASAETAALAGLQSEAVLHHLLGLPVRQREVLVLRYYGQLSEAEIASALGISTGSVKTHSSRALRALRPVLGES